LKEWNAQGRRKNFFKEKEVEAEEKDPGLNK